MRSSSTSIYPTTADTPPPKKKKHKKNKDSFLPPACKLHFLFSHQILGHSFRASFIFSIHTRSPTWYCATTLAHSPTKPILVIPFGADFSDRMERPGFTAFVLVIVKVSFRYLALATAHSAYDFLETGYRRLRPRSVCYVTVSKAPARDVDPQLTPNKTTNSITLLWLLPPPSPLQLLSTRYYNGLSIPGEKAITASYQLQLDQLFSLWKKKIKNRNPFATFTKKRKKKEMTTRLQREAAVVQVRLYN